MANIEPMPGYMAIPGEAPIYPHQECYDRIAALEAKVADLQTQIRLWRARCRVEHEPLEAEVARLRTEAIEAMDYADEPISRWVDINPYGRLTTVAARLRAVLEPAP